MVNLRILNKIFSEEICNPNNNCSDSVELFFPLLRSMPSDVMKREQHNSFSLYPNRKEVNVAVVNFH